MKAIKREFSVARTLQQNGVAKRKNRTLIEAARTMLLDSLLPTTFWAEAADEGFFVGYSINSKAFRVFNTRTRKVEENLHITFFANKPNVAGSGPDWLFDIDLLTKSMNYEPITTGNQTNKNAVADDAGKKTNEEPANEGERNGQKKEGRASNKEDDQNVQDFRAALDNLLVQQKKGYANNTNRDRIRDTGIFSGAYDDEERMDVKSAFLYGTIEEELYVCQPPSFEDPLFPDKVYKVEKALYGLHQAPRAWYETLSTYLLENGFRRGTIDKTLFIKKDKGDIMLVQVYVDDIIFGSTKKSLCVKQKDDGIFISQDKYVANILKKFDFVTMKTTSTPIETNKALLKDEEAEDVDVHLYKSMIGSLMYLTTSQPNLMFSICACARFQVTPKVSHLHAMKRIFRYLKGQPKLGLWYPRDSPFDLEAFSDSDYAGASLDRKSTIGGVVDGDSYEKRLIQVIKIHIDHNVADLLIKAFDVSRMERAATTASSLEAEHDSGNINRTQSMATLNESIPQGTDSSSGLRCQDTILGVQKLKLDRVPRINLCVLKASLTAVAISNAASITSYFWFD
ncbi:uncharacterized mitochondrial protein-like protein [Tanacetum coccineum]